MKHNLIVCSVVLGIVGASAFGGVDYIYNIGKYQVTAGQYTESLNTVAGAGAQTVVVDFDDLSSGNSDFPLPSDYAGLLWDPNWRVWVPNHDYHASSDPHVIYSHDPNLWIDFSPLGHPVTFEGFFLSGYADAVTYVEGYRDGQLVGTSPSYAPAPTPQWAGADLPGLVDRVVVISQNYKHVVVDDVTYTVPEPVTLGLLGLGALGLLGRRRKHAGKARG